MPASQEMTELDPIDEQIIVALQQNGRRSYSSMAKIVGLSEAAVRARVHRLIDSGVMQIAAITDPIRAGMRRQCLIGIGAEGDLRHVADELARITEVDYVVICAGSYDIVIEIVVADDNELLRVLNDKVRAVTGVVRTDTLIYLKLVKQTYVWGAV